MTPRVLQTMPCMSVMMMVYDAMNRYFLTKSEMYV